MYVCMQSLGNFHFNKSNLGGAWAITCLFFGTDSSVVLKNEILLAQRRAPIIIPSLHQCALLGDSRNNSSDIKQCLASAFIRLAMSDYIRSRGKPNKLLDLWAQIFGPSPNALKSGYRVEIRWFLCSLSRSFCIFPVSYTHTLCTPVLY